MRGMNTQIIHDWLDAMARTASAGDHAAHMALVSREVKVYGVPGFEVIGYDDWSRQCAHEFAQGVIARVTYSAPRVLTETAQRVMFKTEELIETRAGETIRQGIEVILEQESDGAWRVTQERVLPSEEVAFDQRRGH
jgi:hypothetical protein